MRIGKKNIIVALVILVILAIEYSNFLINSSDNDNNNNNNDSENDAHNKTAAGPARIVENGSTHCDALIEWYNNDSSRDYFWRIHYNKLVAPYRLGIFNSTTNPNRMVTTAEVDAWLNTKRQQAQLSQDKKVQDPLWCYEGTKYKNTATKARTVRTLWNAEVLKENDMFIKRFPELDPPRTDIFKSPPHTNSDPSVKLVDFKGKVVDDPQKWLGFEGLDSGITDQIKDVNYIAIMDRAIARTVDGKVFDCNREIQTGGCVCCTAIDWSQYTANPQLHTKRLVTLSQYWSYGYYHFVTEALSRLPIIYDSLMEAIAEGKQDEFMVQVVGHDSFITDYLSGILGIPKEMIKAGAESIMADEVWYTPQSKCIFPSITNLLRTRDLIFRRIDSEIALEDTNVACLHVEKPGEYILMINRRGNQRSLRNFDELVEAVKQEFPNETVRDVYLTDLPVQEQIKLMQKAKLFVAPHGAGLSNMIYMPLHPTSTVFEYLPQNYAAGAFYKLARQLDFQYWYSVVPNTNKGSILDANVTETLGAIRQILLNQEKISSWYNKEYN